MSNILRTIFILSHLSVFIYAQEVDVSPSKIREKFLLDAQKLMATRFKESVLPATLANPFIEKGIQESISDSSVQGDHTADTTTSPPVPQDVLIQVANKIPATGTANFSGQFFLLAGQKKFKAGDKMVLDLAGQPYELIITSITSTGFTVQKGEFTYTRAIRLPKSLTSSSSHP